MPSQTALLVAVTANQAEIVQDLLSLGADINACDVNGQTALHLASHYGFPGALQVEKQETGQLSESTADIPSCSYIFPPQAVLSSRPAVNLETRNFEGKDTILDTENKRLQQQQQKTPEISTQVFGLTLILLLTTGMTALHCAAISHSATMKVLNSSGQLDMALQNKAADKLACVQMLLGSGASLLSQVGRPLGNSDNLASFGIEEIIKRLFIIEPLENCFFCGVEQNYFYISTNLC